MTRVSVIIFKNRQQEPFYTKEFMEKARSGIFYGSSAFYKDGHFTLGSDNTVVAVEERHLSCQRHGQTEAEIAAMARANLVYFNLAAEQLGLYETSLKLHDRTIFICATPSAGLNRQIRDLYNRYCEKYVTVPYEVFTLHDMVGNNDGNKSKYTEIVKFPQQKIEMDYKIDKEKIDNKLEKLGWKVLMGDLMLGSILICSALLAAVEDNKT